MRRVLSEGLGPAPGPFCGTRSMSPGAIVAPLAGGLCAYWLPALSVVWPGFGEALGVVTRLEREAGTVLSFDDGPHPQGTPAVLERLADAKVPAVFFLVGEQVERRPRLAAEIAAAGHEVAVHCHRHRGLLRLTPAQVSDDLRRAAAAIGEASGQAPRRYRPPYGVLNAAGLAYAARRGWQPVLWSRDGHDWRRGATADSIAARLTRGVRAGDILMLHDADFYGRIGSWRRTAAALPAVLEELQRRELGPAIPASWRSAPARSADRPRREGPGEG